LRTPVDQTDLSVDRSALRFPMAVDLWGCRSGQVSSPMPAMLAHLCSLDVDIDVARNCPEIKYEQEPDLPVLGLAGQVAGRVCVP
jgi:hypothetical protein